MLTTLCRYCSVLLCCLVFSGCASKNIDFSRKAAYEAYEAEEYATAADHFEQLVEVVPKESELWFRLGNSYARTGQPKKAVTAYENALLRNPALSKASCNMGLIYLQQSLKAFVDMERYTDENDPIARRGEHLREDIFRLLENTGKETEDDD